jgi:hypothetical protein
MGSAGPLTHWKINCSWTVSWVNVIQSMLSHSASVRSFLGAFVKLRKATIRFAMSVCPSVRMKQLGSHWTYFYEIWYWNIFQKSVEEIRVSLKSNKNNGNLHEDRCAFVVISPSLLLRMRKLQTKFAEKTKTYGSCSVTFFFFSKIVPFMRKCGQTF